MERRCVFSASRKYRYTLWREWKIESITDLFCDAVRPVLNVEPRGEVGEKGYAMFIGLNPSTADETLDDPTIRRCKDFAKRWGFGALCMTNIFAWRDTKPERMKEAEFPIGRLNDRYLFECAKGAGIVVAAWGKHGAHLNRAENVRATFRRDGIPLHALRLNGDGSPEHPLYIPAETKPFLLE